MHNKDLQAAWHFHNGTKHPNGYLLDGFHRFDPINRPMLFKIFPDLDPIPLPLDLNQQGMPALEAISTSVGLGDEERIPDLGELARILHFSAGVTKHIHYPYPWGEMTFRAASCTGALYHIELYLVCKDLPGLRAGVYHYEPSQSTLELLRKGDFRSWMVEASGSEPSLAHAPAALIYTTIPWRNACKYQARAYRHAFWDGGTILSQTLAMATRQELPSKVIMGFVDNAVVQLLDLDPERELPIAVVAIGRTLEDVPQMSIQLEPLNLEVMPTTEGQLDFPAIHEMHEASSLGTPHEVQVWREAAGSIKETKPIEDLIPLQLIPDDELPRDAVEKVILRRGSSRRFSQAPISLAQLSTILDRSLGDIPTDFSRPGQGFLSQPYLIVNDVAGLKAGAYAYLREAEGLEVIRTGNYRQEAGRLALGQALGADASVNVYFMASLRPILEHFGNRGYRVAQMEASILAGKMYLAAYTLGLGATGLTFYDDEVTEFFSPHAKDKSVMFLIALGVPLGRM
jgi:SagB-type dehydrogenase family enzyme